MEMRSASEGFASLVAMVCRRCEARGAMEIVMGVPESSVRGFCMGWAGVAVVEGDDGAAVVARVRRRVWWACVRAEMCSLPADVD